MNSIDVVANLAAVRTRIAEAALRAGRQPEDVTLVAVSKTKPFELIRTLYEAGHHDFGENRVEEALPKIEEGAAQGLESLRWHMIGSVQSRKSGQVVKPFVLLHSLDRIKLANRLSRDANSESCVLSVLLQVNVSGEQSKHGFTPESLRDSLADVAQLPNLKIRGLMTMAPHFDDPEATRAVFRQLSDLRDRLADSHPGVDLSELSMGMTNDYEVAIEEGATIVRIGSAIFGAR